jgi:hypothetical protein
MMGRLDRDQGQFLYCFNLEEVVPEDHLVRAIAAVLDLSWVYGELAIRMLIVGYVFAIRSERALCRDDHAGAKPMQGKNLCVDVHQ